MAKDLLIITEKRKHPWAAPVRANLAFIKLLLNAYLQSMYSTRILCVHAMFLLLDMVVIHDCQLDWL